MVLDPQSMRVNDSNVMVGRWNTGFFQSSFYSRRRNIERERERERGGERVRERKKGERERVNEICGIKMEVFHNGPHSWTLVINSITFACLT